MSGARARVPLVAVLVAVATFLLSQSRVVLHSCVDAGQFAPFGLQLALLRDGAHCPAGTYGLGPASTGAVLLLSVGLPALLTHLVLAACGWGTWQVVRGCVRALAATGRGGLVLPAAPAHVPAVRRGLVPVALAPSGATRHVAMLTWSHRGPPLAV